MSQDQLTIIPAGAGSGKTYTIQKRLAGWIAENKVSASKIVAVTFTEAAATELRGRIRDELIESKCLVDALNLDQSYISTIHGFGLRLLTEFAFDCGMNPSPRLLTVDEEKQLIRLALASNDYSLEIIKNLTRFGYKFEFSTKTSAEDGFREVVLAVMAKLRTIGTSAEGSNSAAKALERIRDLYGSTVNAEGLKKTLLLSIQLALTAFPQDVSSLSKTTGVAETLRKNHRLLRQVVSHPDMLDSNWDLWQQLRELQLSTARNKLPAEYDEVISAVISAADSLMYHPGPLDDALAHALALINTAQNSLSIYKQQKQSKGLLDFTDMLALAHVLLMENPSVLELLKQRFECLVIDEFQDTNPLQFSLLWLFQQADIPTLIVGDIKQAIMGFQNADSRLLEQLQLQNSQRCEPLTGNYRTCAELMHWVNDIGTGLFSSDYTVLEPKADFPSSIGHLEAISFSRSNTIKKNASHTVERIRDLLADKTAVVYDRNTGESRPVRGEDVALICPRNKNLNLYADLMRKAGIAVQISEEGWFESRPIQLLYHALSYVADPSDRHAALYLAVTELGEDSLEDALKEMLLHPDARNLKSKVLQKLQPLAQTSVGRNVGCVVQDVIAAIDLFGCVVTWPESAQARANILRFEAEARDFEMANREALAIAGYYGSGLKTFLVWLQQRVQVKEGNQQPQPCVKNENAVELVSWHRSKGREWPIVVFAGCRNEIITRLPDNGISYDDFSDFSAILQKAWLNISPKFAAPEKCELFLDEIRTESYDSSKRLLYVALTRAREKIILEWPEYLDNGKDRKSYTFWELLVETTGFKLNANVMTINGNSYPCRVKQVGKDGADISVAGQDVETPLVTTGRRAIIQQQIPQNLTPEVVRPSVHDDQQVPPVIDLDLFHYCAPFTVDFGLSATEQGTVMHRCYEVLVAQCSIERLRQSTGYEFTEEQHTSVKQQVANFYTWLEQELKPLKLHTEVAILATDDRGSVINGFIDLLVETEAGYWIIDHKTDHTDDLRARFMYYLPQLQLYSKAIEQQCPDKPVLGIGVNWISSGDTMLFNHSSDYC